MNEEFIILYSWRREPVYNHCWLQAFDDTSVHISKTFINDRKKLVKKLRRVLHYFEQAKLE